MFLDHFSHIHNNQIRTKNFFHFSVITALRTDHILPQRNQLVGAVKTTSSSQGATTGPQHRPEVHLFVAAIPLKVNILH